MHTTSSQRAQIAAPAQALTSEPEVDTQLWAQAKVITCTTEAFAAAAQAFAWMDDIAEHVTAEARR